MALLVYFALISEAYLTKVWYNAPRGANGVAFRHRVETNRRHFPLVSEQPSHRTWQALTCLGSLQWSYVQFKKVWHRAEQLSTIKMAWPYSGHIERTAWTAFNGVELTVYPRSGHAVYANVYRVISLPTHDIALRFGFVLGALDGTVKITAENK